MGHASAQGMVEVAGVNEMTLSWHLTSNHYPPLPTTLVPVALQAIEHAGDDEWDALLDLPEGIIFKDQSSAPVHEIISNFHLEAFIT